ncbi:hypothetical protein [Ectobacillus panaciterrae]|uniref:hypothetical protein n=1 Tax=Ectobacillus panaciterrae TaxID=363872 RepID=UPI000490E109|nr:hypothetical protein [Ectobacillus panaciterrae]
MAKRTGWTYLLMLTWLSALVSLLLPFTKLIPNQSMSLGISIIGMVIGAGASLTGLYLLKKTNCKSR